MTDDERYPLGKPIRPEPSRPVPPRRFNSDGTIYTTPDGKMGTAIPPPPTQWDAFLGKAKP